MPKQPDLQPAGAAEVRVQSFMAAAGCTPRIGHPKAGDIGILVDDTIPERYSCNGVKGERIRSAVDAFRQARATRNHMASSLAGYHIRNYLGSTEFCWGTVMKTYVGDILTSMEVVVDGPCFWAHYYWEEWVPYGSGDVIPPGGASGGGDGPFFSPDDPLGREPTIDTMPDYDDHTCDSWRFDDTTGVRKMNFKCLTELDDTLKAIIWDSLDQYLKPLNQISDTLARRECDSLAHWFREVRTWEDTNSFDRTVIYKGRTDSLTIGPQHDGQSFNNGAPFIPSAFHIDPKVYTKAGTIPGKKKLLGTLLHEVAHAWGGADHDTTTATAAGGYQNYPYFRSLHHANACVI